MVSSDCTRSKGSMPGRTAYVSFFVNLERVDIQFTNYVLILHGRFDYRPAYSYNNQISSEPVFYWERRRSFLGGKAQDHLVVPYVADITRGICDTQTSTV